LCEVFFDNLGTFGFNTEMGFFPKQWQKSGEFFQNQFGEFFHHTLGKFSVKTPG